MGGRGDGHEDFGFEAHLGEGGGGGLRKGYARGEEGDGVEDREVGAVEGCEEAKALDHKVPRGGTWVWRSVVCVVAPSSPAPSAILVVLIGEH